MTPDEQKAALEALNTSLDRLAANLRAAWPELEKLPSRYPDTVIYVTAEELAERRARKGRT